MGLLRVFKLPPTVQRFGIRFIGDSNLWECVLRVVCLYMLVLGFIGDLTRVDPASRPVSPGSSSPRDPQRISSVDNGRMDGDRCWKCLLPFKYIPLFFFSTISYYYVFFPGWLMDSARCVAALWFSSGSSFCELTQMLTEQNCCVVALCWKRFLAFCVLERRPDSLWNHSRCTPPLWGDLTRCAVWYQGAAVSSASSTQACGCFLVTTRLPNSKMSILYVNENKVRL